MGRQSRKKRDKRTGRDPGLEWAIGLPPTLASIRTLKKGTGQHSNHEIGSDEKGREVLILHPDFEEAEKAQMEFDRAVFTKIPKVGLLRHPYESEPDLRALYEKDYGPGSSENVLLMLYVTCPTPVESGIRSKEPRVLEAGYFLHDLLSDGKCALIGENRDGSLFYGLMFQRLPIEIIADGIIPNSAPAP
jgi:hypothetical protein